MPNQPCYRVGDSTAPTYEALSAPLLTQPEPAAELCRAMAGYRVEVFRVLLLDARHRLIRKVTVSRGTISASIVHPREVFRSAIVASAAAIILAHNHPSGDPEPSRDDVAITKRLIRVGELVGIPVLDHIIVVKSGFLSLKRDGHF